MKKLVVLSGAGISAESGIATFRGAGGLWEGHRIEDVATPEAWHINGPLVQEFYNLRRRAVRLAKPNRAHEILVDLESHFEVSIITQNVDDLHERAGSSHVLHLHGEITKGRSEQTELIYEVEQDLFMGSLCPDGGQLRPHIVWFGEAVPMMDEAERLVREADLFVLVGSSLLVYPAAGLLTLLRKNIPAFAIDPMIPQVPYHFKAIENVASEGMKLCKEMLLDLI